MTNVTTIVVDGVNVNIDSEVFQGYTSESFGILKRQEIIKEEFKLLVETVAETTKLKKAVVSKYLKARFNLSTKEPKVEGELFEALDNVLEA